MLFATSTITNYEIEGSDGNFGLVTDVLCDAVKWKMRGLSVANGTVVASAPLLLPAGVVKSIDRPLGKVNVGLSMQAIETSPALEAAGITANKNSDNANLLSLNAMRGFSIHATDGDIGTVFDFLMDDTDWGIRYVIVDTGTWWPGQKVLIAPNSVAKVLADTKQFELNVDKQKVKNAPAYDPSVTVDGIYDEKFLTYYGIRWLEA